MNDLQNSAEDQPKESSNVYEIIFEPSTVGKILTYRIDLEMVL
jgi:hypothetical protein